jgi:hypothetical protein
MLGETGKLENPDIGKSKFSLLVMLKTWFFIPAHATDSNPKYFLLTINRLH